MPIPSPSMTERVARAIAKALGANDWTAYVDAARSAIAEMREPTADMLEAALPDVPDWGYLPDDWRAMIDHISRERVFPTGLNS
jgi:hypothetical protein